MKNVKFEMKNRALEVSVSDEEQGKILGKNNERRTEDQKLERWTLGDEESCKEWLKSEGVSFSLLCELGQVRKYGFRTETQHIINTAHKPTPKDRDRSKWVFFHAKDRNQEHPPILKQT